MTTAASHELVTGKAGWRNAAVSLSSPVRSFSVWNFPHWGENRENDPGGTTTEPVGLFVLNAAFKQPDKARKREYLQSVQTQEHREQQSPKNMVQNATIRRITHYPQKVWL